MGFLNRDKFLAIFLAIVWKRQRVRAVPSFSICHIVCDLSFIPSKRHKQNYHYNVHAKRVIQILLPLWIDLMTVEYIGWIVENEIDLSN